MTDSTQSPYETDGLGAGDQHYRAFVGPPERFDVLGISQIALLHRFGLREHHAVLDFGCGSLRLGRMLLPFLLPEKYYGIEPNAWLIEEGFAHELGDSIRSIKRPSFSSDESFDCRVFGRTFEFIVAQSIITHSGRRETARLMQTAAEALTDDGVILFSYIGDAARAPPPPETGWVYPGCVHYANDEITGFMEPAGLHWRPIAWPHPGAVWAAAARTKTRLQPDFPFEAAV